MTALDWVLVVLFVGIALSGFWKGAARLVFGVGGLVAGVWVASLAGPDLSAALAGAVRPEWLAAVLGRVLPVVVVALLSLAAGWGLERTLEALSLGWLNRLLGAGVAAVAGGVLMTLLVVSAARLSPTFRELCERSTVGSLMLSMVEGSPHGAPALVDPPRLEAPDEEG